MKSLPEIRDLLQSNDEEARRSALQSLRGMPLAETRGMLFSVMGDESWRVRKDAVDVFVLLNPDEPAIEALLELFRDQENAGLRNSAAEAVVRLGSRAIAPLKRKVSDRDADVRKIVVDVMGLIASPEFVPALLSTLHDPDINVASAAAEQLGNIGDIETASGLISAVIENDSIQFRFSALAAIGKLSIHLEVPDEIIKLADQDMLRKVVYECLGSVGDESACSILIQGFISPQRSSRIAAVIAWYRIYSRSTPTVRKVLEESLQEFCACETVAILIDLFDPGNIALSEAVIFLLGITSNMTAAETLLAAVACERLSDVAVVSLKRLASCDMNALLAFYPDAQPASRAAIFTVAGEMNYQIGDTLIRKGLQDPYPIVRMSAVVAAGQLGLVGSIAEIAALLDDSEIEVRKAAINSLQSLTIFDYRTIKELADSLGNSDIVEQRCDAAILYAALGEGEPLTMFVKDTDPSVRQTAISYVGKLHFAEAGGLLLIALVDESPDVRIAAVESLGEVGGYEFLPQLFCALDDDDVWVQCSVLKTIARIDISEAFTAVQKVFDQAEGVLRDTCLELLETIGSSDALAMLEAGIQKRDKEIVKQEKLP